MRERWPSASSRCTSARRSRALASWSLSFSSSASFTPPFSFFFCSRHAQHHVQAYWLLIKHYWAQPRMPCMAAVHCPPLIPLEQHDHNISPAESVHLLTLGQGMAAQVADTHRRTDLALQLLSPFFFFLLILVLIVICTKAGDHILSSLVQFFFAGQLGVVAGPEAANEASPLLVLLPAGVDISQTGLQVPPEKQWHHTAQHGAASHAIAGCDPCCLSLCITALELRRSH